MFLLFITQYWYVNYEFLQGIDNICSGSFLDEKGICSSSLLIISTWTGYALQPQNVSCSLWMRHRWDVLDYDHYFHTRNSDRTTVLKSAVFSTLFFVVFNSKITAILFSSDILGHFYFYLTCEPNISSFMI